MKLFYLFTFLLIASTARAQFTEKIETDRPDQTETPYVIPKKMFQAEFGFGIDKMRSEDLQLTHPTALFKYGLLNRAELRLETTYITEELHYIPQTKKNTVVVPVEVGTKVRLFEEKGLLPKTSFILHIGLPFLASKKFRSDPASFAARISMQNSLSENIALGYNVGVEGGGDEPASTIYTISSGFSIGKKWYTYIEAFGSFTNGDGDHNLDAGVSYCTSNNTKIDLSGGFGLGDANLKNYIALGFSFRLLPKAH